MLWAVGCLHAAQQDRAPAAFSTTGINASVPDNLQGPGVRRVRPVVVNWSLFDETMASTFLEKKREKPDFTLATTMNFFPDADLIVNWTAVERVQQPSGLIWTGTVAGTPSGHATMAVSGQTVTANVTRGDGRIYEIRTSADGVVWVREIDQTGFPSEGNDVSPPPAGVKD